MSGKTFKQEMPPTGGYRPLNFERVLPKRFLSFGKCMFVTLTTPIIWLYIFKKFRRLRYLKELEYRNHSIPLEPCLIAERDRLYLKQLRENRDDEAELMKNVPDWEVGKLFDEKVFKTVPEDKLVDPILSEYYAHTRLAFLFEFFHLDNYR